jgi:plasmid stabilization system protein ParE
MALVVEWSPEAGEDLEQTADYIGRDSLVYAKAVVAKAVDMAESLSRFPQRGRIVPELNDEHFRERFFYSYRLIYRIDEDKVLIVALVHGKRLLENIADRFDESE